MAANRPRALALIVTLTVAGGALGVAAVARRRAVAMQRALDAVIAGDLRVRIAHGGGRATPDRQAAAFNRMLDRIEAEMGDLRHGARDIAHELRSPLVRLRGRIAASASADELVDEIDAILDLFSSLTRLSEVERGARRAGFALVDLAEIVREVVEMLEAVAEDAGDRLIVTALVPTMVLGDANLLRQLLVNLIENALRHTPPGTVVTVSLAQERSAARLSVSDDGPGIPSAQRETAMRRFGRLGTAVEGQGLGLTLVDAIARSHDGAVRLEDALPGLRVLVVLPRP